jgi:cystathionine beta-synthase
MYQVEGIGYDFIPRVCDRTHVDEWVKIGDEEAFTFARRMIREEGFLCGGSSGTAMAACMKYIKEHNIGAGKRCVVVLPDNIRNYITKFINNDWMYEHGFISEKQCMEANIPKLVPHNVWGKNFTIADLNLNPAKFLSVDMTCQEAIRCIHDSSYDQFPVKDGSGEVVGMVTSTLLMSKIANRKVSMQDKISSIMTKDFRSMSSSMPLSELSRVLERQSFVLIDGMYIASSFDVLSFMEDNVRD